MEAMCVLKLVPPKKVGAPGSKVHDYCDCRDSSNTPRDPESERLG